MRGEADTARGGGKEAKARRHGVGAGAFGGRRGEGVANERAEGTKASMNACVPGECAGRMHGAHPVKVPAVFQVKAIEGGVQLLLVEPRLDAVWLRPPTAHT